MLRLLRIRNFAIIDSLELDFHEGFNAITGETGAGKSIILDAIGLILGNRASLDLIRNQADEAIVEALFEIDMDESWKAKLEKHGIPYFTEHFEILIKRSVHRNGKNKILFCGELVTLSQLSDLCENLVDLCSQHEHQSLTKSIYQLDLVDRYGGLETLQSKVGDVFFKVSEIQDRLLELGGEDSERSRKTDFLSFQIKEIEEFNPGSGDGSGPTEDELLQTERKKLLGAENLINGLNETLTLLGSNDSSDNLSSARDLLQRASQRIGKLISFDESLESLNQSISKSLIELEEALFFAEKYISQIESDPGRLEFVEDRLAKWSEIKRKYGSTANDVLETKRKLETELNELVNREEIAKELEVEKTSLLKQYQDQARTLSTKRSKTAVTLQKSIEQELHELHMPGSQFKIAIEKDNNQLSSSGIDRIQFLFSANAGESLKSLTRVASGGELSRVLLSIRRTISNKGGIGVYLFDEIDAGIGGQTASVVGQKLKSVSKHNQVICITHLPQVAAFADRQFSVSKKTVSGRTVSQIDELKQTSRVDELARMLGGLGITDKTRAAAKELLSQAKQ